MQFLWALWNNYLKKLVFLYTNQNTTSGYGSWPKIWEIFLPHLKHCAAFGDIGLQYFPHSQFKAFSIWRFNGVSGEIFGHSQVEVSVFPSRTGYMLTDLFWFFCIKLGYTLYKFLRLEWWVIFLSVEVEPVVCETQAVHGGSGSSSQFSMFMDWALTLGCHVGYN